MYFLYADTFLQICPRMTVNKPDKNILYQTGVKIRVKNLKPAFENKFFQAFNFFFKKFQFNKRCKSEIEVNNEKNAVDSGEQFPTKSILRNMVFTETTRQRGS